MNWWRRLKMAIGGFDPRPQIEAARRRQLDQFEAWGRVRSEVDRVEHLAAKRHRSRLPEHRAGG